MANMAKNRRLVGSLLVLVVVLIFSVTSVTIIEPTERGVAVTLGTPGSEVLGPGMHFHAPMGITRIKKVSVAPINKRMTFSVGTDGAITRDMQTVGAMVEVFWKYDENRIVEAVSQYNKNIIEDAIIKSTIASVKEAVGNYTIYELVENQKIISPAIQELIVSKAVNYPIVVTQLAVTNWDWSDNFDKQIQETMLRTQQVRQAEQDLKLTQTNAQKQVAEAEASKNAAILKAEAELETAKRNAEAKKVEADSIAYYNSKVSQNMTVQREQWQHDEQMAYYNKWNGILVPQYVPLTAAGGIVNIPAPSGKN
jgi:regulator of protease activity HflC (stomatin/prohibitin superfamily)